MTAAPTLAPAGADEIEQFGWIDEASGHEPLYFGKVDGLADYAVSGQRFVRLSDHQASLAAAQEQIAAMREARNAIEREHSKVSGDDGYNYAAGQEYGLRLALIKLDAALTSPAEGGEPVAMQVKPLEWVERIGVTGTFDAESSCGHYIASVTDDGRGHWFIVGLTQSNYVGTTVEEAKAAAQADFERRIRAALTTPQAPAPDWEKAVECATEGCGNKATIRFERGGVGAHYCHDCYMRVQSLPAAPHLGVREG